MSARQVLEQNVIAISISESPDMPVLGLSDEHLRDAMAETARHLLALGARLVYGGDLRQRGFSELLFEIVARHCHDAEADDDRAGVTNYLAWPVHILQPFGDLEKAVAALADTAELLLLAIDGKRMSMQDRRRLSVQQPTDAEWTRGLTAMRERMLAETSARIVLGGRVEQYKGAMPGIAEEALLSLQGHQPLFILGGFGGCARDIAESLGLIVPWAASRPTWPGRAAFDPFSGADLNNGLTPDENATLARTPHVDQAILLILRGLLKVTGANGNS